MEQLRLDQALPDGFQVLATSERAQVATMVLEPGETVGGPDNRHERSDQWLYVIGGEGTATVEGQSIELRAGAFLRIDPGERHKISNDGRVPLKTLNFYAPPEY